MKIADAYAALEKLWPTLNSRRSKLMVAEEAGTLTDVEQDERDALQNIADAMGYLHPPQSNAAAIIEDLKAKGQWEGEPA